MEGVNILTPSPLIDAPQHSHLWRLHLMPNSICIECASLQHDERSLLHLSFILYATNIRNLAVGKHDGMDSWIPWKTTSISRGTPLLRARALWCGIVLEHFFYEELDRWCHISVVEYWAMVLRLKTDRLNPSCLVLFSTFTPHVFYLWKNTKML
jgi:hypothetical protein